MKSKKLGEGEYSRVAEHMPSICGSLDLSPSTAKQISGWTDVRVRACVRVEVPVSELLVGIPHSCCVGECLITF